MLCHRAGFERELAKLVLREQAERRGLSWGVLDGSSYLAAENWLQATVASSGRSLTFISFATNLLRIAGQSIVPLLWSTHITFIEALPVFCHTMVRGTLSYTFMDL